MVQPERAALQHLARVFEMKKHISIQQRLRKNHSDYRCKKTAGIQERYRFTALESLLRSRPRPHRVSPPRPRPPSLRRQW